MNLPHLPQPFNAWFHRNGFDAAVYFFIIASTTFLMASTFQYQDNTIVLSLHIWSDFWANIPLIRSFSMGNNFPVEYPLFAGERIRYHFFFFLLVGLLEKTGIRIDIAINLLSIIGFSVMGIALYHLAKRWSQSHWGGVLAVVGLLFNSSLSWVYYLFGEQQLIKHPLDIVTNRIMATHGPYMDTIISGFWKLNVYTNQRHLAFSFAVLFFAIWSIVYGKRKWLPVIGVLCLATLSWMHKAVLLITFIQLAIFFITTPKRRRIILGSLLLTISLSIPGINYLNGTGISKEQVIRFWPGFLYDSTSWKEFPSLTAPFAKWLIYWCLNWGFLPFTALMGYIAALCTLPTSQKTFLTLPKKFPQFFHKRLHTLLLHPLVKLCTHWLTHPTTPWFLGGLFFFILANTFTFAQDIATNHKFLNYTQMIWIALSAVFLIRLMKSLIGKVFAFPLAVLLILGGVFDLFPIINDAKYYWPDVQSDPLAQWIVASTPPNSVFYNSSYTTNSITITGRKIYWGWDYFTGGVGYDLPNRRKNAIPFLSGQLTKDAACAYLLQEHIAYLAIDEMNKTFTEGSPHLPYFEQHFTPLIHISPITIYDVERSCQNKAQNEIIK